MIAGEPKMTYPQYKIIENNLLFVLEELEKQTEVAKSYPQTVLSYKDQMAQIREFIDIAGEYGLAYESIVGALELFPFKVTGAAAVKLLEIALLMGFKTEREEDKLFDRRKQGI